MYKRSPFIVSFVAKSKSFYDQPFYFSFKESLSCPSPAQGEFDGWGKTGTIHICKITHGPFVAWENGYVHLRGQYENGKEVGEWLWYDANGTVVKKIDYSKPQMGK